MFISWRFLCPTTCDRFAWVRMRRAMPPRIECLVLSSCQFEKAADHARRRQFHISQHVFARCRSSARARLRFDFSEIILFLHQIFYKGLSKKLENWPTFYTGRVSSIDAMSYRTHGCVLGDLFDMFISMLHIYLEYVRNHHYSLQVNTSTSVH